MHDFKKFPELRDDQLDLYYFESPHKQIFESFEAEVVKVWDGDTIRVICDFRDFDFPIRLANIQAPERKEPQGMESKEWLANLIMGERVIVGIEQWNRVDRWGRLLGIIYKDGINLNELSVNIGINKWWEGRKGELPTLDEMLK